jgi:hypothetical protein
MHRTFTGQIAAQRIAELHQAAERWRLCKRQTAPEAARPRRRSASPCGDPARPPPDRPEPTRLAAA